MLLRLMEKQLKKKLATAVAPKAKRLQSYSILASLKVRKFLVTCEVCTLYILYSGVLVSDLGYTFCDHYCIHTLLGAYAYNSTGRKSVLNTDSMLNNE